MEIIRDDNNEMKNTTQNLTVTVPTTTCTTSTTSLTSREGRIFTVPVNIIPMFEKYNQQHKHKHKHKHKCMSTTSMTTTSTTTSLHASSSTCSSSSNNSNSNSDGSEEEETIVHTNSSQRQQAQNDNDNDNNRLDISSDILEKVIEYCTYYTTVEPMNDIPRPLRSNHLKELVTQEWYYNFISSMSCMDNNHDHNDNDDNDHAIVLFRLVNAANHLKIQPLLNLAVLATALCINSRIVRGDGDYDVNMEDIKSVFKVPSSSTSTSSSSSSSSSLLSPSSSSSSMISSSSPSPSSPLSKSTTRSSTQKTKDIETSPLLFSQVNTFNT